MGRKKRGRVEEARAVQSVADDHYAIIVTKGHSLGIYCLLENEDIFPEADELDFFMTRDSVSFFSCREMI